jgi:hypothetical protein
MMSYQVEPKKYKKGVVARILRIFMYNKKIENTVTLFITPTISTM